MTQAQPDGHEADSGTPGTSTAFDPSALDPVAVIRSRAYLSALVLAALLGVPISAAAYGFLALTSKLQQTIFEDLPGDIFTGTTPAWWPLPWLLLCGLLT